MSLPEGQRKAGKRFQKIGTLLLSTIPEGRQTILWVWDGHRDSLDPHWLEGVCKISRWRPELRIRTAHLSRDQSKGAHVDGVPGANLIWVHRGNGFFIEDEAVEMQPGDVILFERGLSHGVEAMGEYVRTVITTVSEDRRCQSPRFLENGIFYNEFEPLEIL